MESRPGSLLVSAEVVSWAENGIIKRHAYNGHEYLYELPPSSPVKHSSRWDRLSERPAVFKIARKPKPSDASERGVV